MRQKKNGFFRLIFSFMPGAAEMYMGFMKYGVSLMAVFFLSLMIPAILQVSDVFLFVAVLIWFYGFFHARSLSGCPLEEFQTMPDEYVWEAFAEGKHIPISNPTLRKWGAGALIFFGVILLWENLTSVLYWLIPDEYWNQLAPLVDRVPQTVIAFVIIFIGVKLIQGKKEELDGKQ